MPNAKHPRRTRSAQTGGDRRPPVRATRNSPGTPPPHTLTAWSVRDSASAGSMVRGGSHVTLTAEQWQTVLRTIDKLQQQLSKRLRIHQHTLAMWHCVQTQQGSNGPRSHLPEMVLETRARLDAVEAELAELQEGDARIAELVYEMFGNMTTFLEEVVETATLHLDALEHSGDAPIQQIGREVKALLDMIRTCCRTLLATLSVRRQRG